MKKLKISIKNLSIVAELNKSETAEKIHKILPIKTKITKWGNELYFTIPMHTELEADSREILEIGELGFWPTGNAFCIFWGPTPLSTDNNPRAVSPVNIFGKIIGDTTVFNKVLNNDNISIEAID